MTSLDETLSTLKALGKKALVPYLVGGLSDDWIDCVRAAIHAGADLIEIGLPFSDPIMDGVVIQRASDQALARGTTLRSILADLEGLDSSVPLVAMTYFNVFHHHGLERSAAELSQAGVTGSIVPDLSLEELGPWRGAANAADVATVLMVAPSTPDERVQRLATSSQGFVYAAARMAVTGVAAGAGDSAGVVARIKQYTSTPVYVGIGIAEPAQAAAACEVADGAIVGTALVSRLLDGEGPLGVERFVDSLRRAID